MISIFLLSFFMFGSISATDSSHHLQKAYEYKQSQNVIKALEHLEIARSQEPTNINLWFECAYLYATIDEYEKAETLYKKVIQHLPNNPDLLYNLGYVLKKQNKMLEAIEVYEKILQANQSSGKVLRALSHAYLAIGDFEKGWPAYEYRWVNPPAYNLQLKQYLDHGGSLVGKTVLLKTEYGLGDTFHFIRYAKTLKAMGARIIVECHRQSLIPLLSLCSYIDTIIAPGEKLPPSDFQALIMSMPWILNTTLDTIPAEVPYLYADQGLEEGWKQNLVSDKKYKIGICW